MASPLTHTTVLLNEAVDALLGRVDGDQQHLQVLPVEAPQVFVDATFGRGGHSRLILSRLGPHARLIAFDKDLDALAEAATVSDPRFSIRHQGFSHLGELPDASVAGVLLDLGISSPQVDNPARGFSFRFAGPIAKAIVARRQARGPLVSTTELAQLVADTVKTRESGQNPATRTFQAFRIFINAELEELQQALEASLRVLQPGGRLVVISFHSLEDRIVKQFIAKHAREVFDRRAPFAAPHVMQFNALSRIKPSAAEVAGNPRSRSAIMRVAERTAAGAPVQRS